MRVAPGLRHFFADILLTTAQVLSALYHRVSDHQSNERTMSSNTGSELTVLGRI